jgi:ABC-type Fe3+-hydroxamate transport system substrate-binding protein
MKFARFLLYTAALTCFSTSHASLVFKDDTGQEFRLKAPAKRIVTLAPHAAESLYAAGGGDRLVGTVEYSDYPPEANQSPMQRRMPFVNDWKRCASPMPTNPRFASFTKYGNPR